MAVIYLFNTNLINSNIELFNLPGAFFNGNFDFYLKNIFGYFDKVWFSSYDLKYLNKDCFLNRNKTIVVFNSYGKILLDPNKNKDFNRKIYSNGFDSLQEEKKIYFVLSSNYIRNEFGLVFIFKYTLKIYIGLCELQKYFDSISTKKCMF